MLCPKYSLRAMHKKLLSSSFASFVIGDLGTTYMGLYYYPNQIIEGNAIPALMINELGLWSLIPIKIAIFGIFYLLYRISPDPHKIGVPIGLTTIGVIVTLWNILLLLSL